MMYIPEGPRPWSEVDRPVPSNRRERRLTARHGRSGRAQGWTKPNDPQQIRRGGRG